MIKLTHKSDSKEIYRGEIKNIEFNLVDNTSQHVILDLSAVFEKSQALLATLTLEELKFVCSSSKIVASIYPNGNCGLSKIASQTDPVSTCYLVPAQGNIVVLIAMDEVQPMLYSVQLIAIFELHY
jgi:hypothetical protein